MSGLREYSIAFAIAGKLSRSFESSFKNAGSSVNELNDRLAAMNAEAGNIGKLLKNRTAVEAHAKAYKASLETYRAAEAHQKILQSRVSSLSSQYAEAKRALSSYGASINRSKAVSDEMIARYEKQEQQVKALAEALKYESKQSDQFSAFKEKQKRSLDKAKAGLDRERESLRSLSEGMGVSSRTTQSLIDRQNALAKSAEKAIAAQQRLQKLSAIQSGLKSGAVDGAGKLAMMQATVMSSNLSVPVQQAMKMEDAMADIAKVADFDTPDGLKNLQKELQKMSLLIPLSADGLAQIAAAAAQSGIATKDLAGFTEQAAKMAVAFDISAQDAGKMMAKWKSGMGLTNEETYRLADAVNYLSNNNAALASEIGDTIKRYGALGKVAGLTAEQTAALSASVIGAGANSDTAATGIKAMMRAMGSGGSMSGVQAAAFMNVGIDPKQLQKNLQKDAPAAILSTLEAIQTKLPKEKWNQYLTAMFGDEAAVAIGPMMQNLYGLRVNFERVADPAKYAGSMLGEFKSRAATTSNALALAKNSVDYFCQALGAPLLDPLKQGAEQFVKWGEYLGDWVSNNKSFVVSLMKIGGALAAGVAGFHALRIAMFFTVGPIVSLYKGALAVSKAIMFVRNSAVLATAAGKAWAFTCSATTVAMSTMKSAATMAGRAISGIGWLASKALMLAWRAACVATNATLGALTTGAKLFGVALKLLFTNPIGLAITAAVGLVAVGVQLYKNWDTVKEKLGGLGDWFSEKFSGISAVVNGFAAGFADTFDSLIGIAKTTINWIIEKLNGLIEKVNSIGSLSIPGIGSVGVNIPTIPQLASGGIATRPTLAMVGEGGESEAIVPLSKLTTLLKSGVGNVSTRTGVTVNLTINVSGGANSADDVRRGVNEAIPSLKRELERLMSSQRRLSYV